MNYSKYWIENLEMTPHPEGGYYKEIYRNQLMVSANGYPKKKNAATSIYYLLEYGDKSHFHRLKSDEIWYYHTGGSLIVSMFITDGNYIEETLGTDFRNNEKLQIIIPAGTIFGAYLSNPGSYILMGCMVNPGFDFEDFELIDKCYLLNKYPEKKEVIEKLT